MKNLIISISLFLVATLILSYRFWGYPDKLVEKYGIIRDYSFTIDSDGRGGKNYQYLFSLNRDGSQYRIPAKFVDDFNKESFEQQVKIGDTVTLLIDQLPNSLNGDITVYELRSGTESFLSAKEATKTDKLEKNIAIPFFFVLFSLIGLLNYRKYKNKK
ncbi:hypothetical protein [uncultured Pontibacter sp.]|uniref:hypothetical protein n=1 Tax=uncultured Pontibacter sp. TaxID=453356 RepID=UPI0026183AB5|nr:hypothetical protein [uncultured Pontibacter sp.]